MLPTKAGDSTFASPGPRSAAASSVEQPSALRGGGPQISADASPKAMWRQRRCQPLLGQTAQAMLALPPAWHTPEQQARRMADDLAGKAAALGAARSSHCQHPSSR